MFDKERKKEAFDTLLTVALHAASGRALGVHELGKQDEAKE